MDDFTASIRVKQIASYPQVPNALPDDLVLVQRFGLGGPYIAMPLAELMGSALLNAPTPGSATSGGPIPGIALTWSAPLSWNQNWPAGQPGAGPEYILTAGDPGLPGFHMLSPLWVEGDISANGSVFGQAVYSAGDIVATVNWVNGIIANWGANSVASFNTRTGAVALTLDDIKLAGGAVAFDLRCQGTCLAPTHWNPQQADDTIATCLWVQNAVSFAFEEFLELENLTGGSPVATITTVAGLSPVSSTNVPVGVQEIVTLGYYAVGDGGGARYILAPVQSADDGRIQSLDGQWWQYIPETKGVNCKSFGAKPDAVDAGNGTATGTDSTVMIQSAINFALRNRIRTVFLPDGNYLTTNTLHLGWGNGLYSLNFEGASAESYGGLAGTMIIFTATDRQCINVAGARLNVIRNIQFFFPQNFYWVSNNVVNVRPTDPLAIYYNLPSLPSGWVDPTITNALAPRAPLAAITVDGFAGTKPSPSYPVVTFPAWTGLTTQYSKNAYSSNVQIIGCFFKGWPVGVAAGVNTDAQGDFIVVNNCYFVQGVYGISVCNTQARSMDIKDIYFQFLHTLLDNGTFGSANGTWLASSINNLSGGECYQIFNLNGSAVPLQISNLYSEGGLRRLGVIKGAFAALKLLNWHVGFTDSQYGAERALVEAGVSSGSIIFDNCFLSSHYGIQSLVYGNIVGTVLAGGNYFLSGSRFTSSSVAGYQARNYGGGFIINSQATYPASQNQVRGENRISSTWPSGAGNSLWSDRSCQNEVGVLYMFIYREGLKFFRDNNAREWRIKQTSPVVTPVTGSGLLIKGSGIVSGLAQTGETVTFTYNLANPAREANYGYNNWGFSVGDILIDQPTGALLVVTAKTGTAPTISVTAVQQNCYTNNVPGGTWTTTTTLANGTPTTVPASGGSFQIVRTYQQFSQTVFFGDFTSGSPNVVNVHAGDLDGSHIATYLPVGMLLFAPGVFNNPLATVVQSPIATEFPVTRDTYIGTVTNGANSTTPGSLTLTRSDGVTAANAVNTGRYAITPLGLGVP